MVWQESGANGGGDNQAWVRLGDNTSDRLLRFATEDSGGGAILNVGDGDIPGGLTDNNWHYLVTVRQGNRTSVYIDGVKVGEMSGTTTKNVSNEQDFKIATQQRGEGFESYFTGSIDDIVIYNKALSEAEIAALFEM